MFNLNKKGFFMTETLMVIVFVASIFTFIYISVIPLIGKYNDKAIRESDIDIVYKLFSIRKAINKDTNKTAIINNNVKSITCNDFSANNQEYCNELMSDLELDNYALIFTKSISAYYDDIINTDVNIKKQLEDYLGQYKDENESALILLDNSKHTIVHLTYVDPDMDLGDLLVYKASKKKCNPIFTDTDGVKYFSGTNECIDFNYVWYSGKLWRITAVYPDGAMKMITQNNITSIAFNASGQVNFWTDANTASYMYQWLNEDFYDTLYNASEFIDTTKMWNATMPANTTISTKPLETNMVTANVGLLNSYEYYNSYRCISSAACTGSSYDIGYLRIKHYWLLLNPYNASSVSTVSYDGLGSNSNPANARGVRPSIYLKSGVEFIGSGTSDNPYKIVGDKDTGRANDLINTRISGEYIKLKNSNTEQTFRIVGVEDGKAKIIAMDYADNKATRKFATSEGTANTLWGSGTTTGTDTWYTYLNNTYLPSLRNTYGELFDSSIYYLGTSGYNYKLSVCANTTSGNTKECDKTSQVGTFDIGLPRYGEMFATTQGGHINSISLWLMNRNTNTSRVWSVNSMGYGYFYEPIGTFGGRPTLHLKSSVKIKSGKGTYNDPYVVGL